MVRDSKRSFFQKAVLDGKDTSTLWRALNALSGKGKGSGNATPIPTQLTAEVFNDYFLSIPTRLLPSNTFTEPSDKCTDKLQQFCSEKLKNKHPFKIPHIGVHEVGRYISQLGNKKSSGPDGISNHILKLSVPYIVESLTYIFNLSIDQNIFPAPFKKAKVVPLPKNKDTLDVNNYRPISLLSVLSKILEKHAHKYLSRYLESNSLLHPLQSGFRSRHSCASALTLLTDKWLEAINKFKISGVTFLDFTKAFDLVDHTLLIQKLSVYLKNSKSLSFFRSFLENRTQEVFVHGTTSREGNVTHGVPQGSVLGPVLFCMFINDLPLHISSSVVECHMLADDTTLQTQCSSPAEAELNLQSALNDVSHWCKTNKMILNPRKSKSMLITTRQKHQRSSFSINLLIEGKSIEQVSEHKLLGLIVDEKLQWQPHTDHLSKILSKNLYLLSRLQSVIPQDARKLFFNGHIKPHFDYASIVWDGLSDNLFKRLNSLHRRAVKLINPNKQLTTDEKYTAIGMLSLQQQLLYNKSVMMYKTINKQMPLYLMDMFKTSPSPYSIYKQNLILPKARLDISKTSFSFAGASVWNSLPQHVKAHYTISSFKTSLVRHLLQCGVT
jgi:hypothetical protein